MRTETVTVEYNVYKFNELSNDAKENVKEWYLKGQEPFIFTDDCKMDLYNLFGKNNLDVEYSLGYRQGDGFNIYGNIDAESIFNLLCMKTSLMITIYILYNCSVIHQNRIPDISLQDRSYHIRILHRNCGMLREINLQDLPFRPDI